MGTKHDTLAADVAEGLQTLVYTLTDVIDTLSTIRTEAANAVEDLTGEYA